MAKVKKRRIKLKVIPFLIFIAILVSLFFIGKESLNIRTKNILIKGNNYLSDYEVMTMGDIIDYPKFITLNTYELEKRIKESPFVSKVKVRKRFLFVLEIDIEEAYPIYFDNLNNKEVLSNFKDVDEYYPSPRLINKVKEEKLESFNKAMLEIDKSILSLISEIEYIPNEFDEDRFLLYMNDGNAVYLTLTKFESINYYNEVLPQLEGHKGILYLDSGNHFQIMG